MLLKPANHASVANTLAYLYVTAPDPICLAACAPHMPVEMVSSPDDKHTYNYISNNVDAIAKPSMYAVAAPLIPGACFAPAKSEANTKATIVGRVTSLRNTSTPTPFIIQCIREFATLLIPDDMIHRLTPLAIEQVEEKQSRPSQRSTFAACVDRLDVMKTSFQCFQKAESYPKITDPRNIINPSVDHRVKYASFIYAFNEHIMKKQPWYAFGKSPAEFTDRLVQLASENDILDEGDYHRFDGTQGPIQTLLFLSCLLRAFAIEFHEYLSETSTKQIEAPAYCNFDLKFNTMWMTISGSADTSARNTLVNAFTAYTANRMSKNRDHDPSPQEAFAKLGLFGGDDSINTAFTSVNIEAAARIMGLSLVKKQVSVNHYVTFLGRVYLNPWTTRHNIADPYRCLSKFHLTATNPQTADATTVLRRKAESWLVTDPTTPIIAPLCRAILRRTPNLTDKQLRMTEADLSYWARVARETPFDTPPAGDVLTREVICEILGITQVDMETIEQEIENSSDWIVFPSIKPRTTALPKYQILVGGEVLNSDGPKIDDDFVSMKDEVVPATMSVEQLKYKSTSISGGSAFLPDDPVVNVPAVKLSKVVKPSESSKVKGKTRAKVASVPKVKEDKLPPNTSDCSGCCTHAKCEATNSAASVSHNNPKNSTPPLKKKTGRVNHQH